MRMTWMLLVVGGLLAACGGTEPRARADETLTDQGTGFVSEERETVTAMACPGSFCSEAEQCSCSSALTADCINNRCVYTYPGNGGGDGPICPQRFCSDDDQCVCGTRQGFCTPQSTCQF